MENDWMDNLRKKEDELRKINDELDQRKPNMEELMSNIDRAKILKESMDNSQDDAENRDPNDKLLDDDNYDYEQDDVYVTKPGRSQEDLDGDRPYITQQIDDVKRKEEMRKLKQYDELLEQSDEQGNMHGLSIVA